MGETGLGVYAPSSVRALTLDTSRVVKLVGVVDSYTAKNVIKKLGDLNEESLKPITLVINSPGGSVIDGAGIIGAIEASRAPVNTVCIKLCASMGAFIHQYGAKREVFSHALLMFHPAYGGAVDDIDRMSALISTIKRYVNKMEVNVAKRAKLSFEEYKSRSGINIWIDGEDAVKAGFADEVVFYKGTSISALFEDAEKEYEDSAKRQQIRKLRMFIKNSLSFLAQYFGGSSNLEDELQSTFSDIR
jgi:ATP-dependent Clp protease protease subunit